jgi:hypothetical protein
MTKVYSAGARGYRNVTTGVGRLLLVMGGAWLMFRPKEAPKRVYRERISNPAITYYSDIGAMGLQTKDIENNETIIGARDQIQLTYSLSNVKSNLARIKYGDTTRELESPNGIPFTFTISKSTVIAELDKNGYLQVEVSVVPASTQADTHSVSFRYEGA